MKSKSSQRTQILLVEPNTKIAHWVERTLQQTNDYEVCQVQQSKAVQAARTTRPQLLMIDARLDQMTGLQLFRQLQTQGLLEDVPVIFICGQEEPELQALAQNDCSVFCLTRPMTEAILLDLVDKALWMPHLMASNLKQLSLQAQQQSTRHSIPAPPRRSPEIIPELHLRPIDVQTGMPQA